MYFQHNSKPFGLVLTTEKRSNGVSFDVALLPDGEATEAPIQLRILNKFIDSAHVMAISVAHVLVDAQLEFAGEAPLRALLDLIISGAVVIDSGLYDGLGHFATDLGRLVQKSQLVIHVNWECKHVVLLLDVK